MNNAVGNPSISNTRSRIKVQVVATVCWLALALSAAAALWGGMVNQSTRDVSSAPTSRPAAMASTVGDQTTRQVVFYLVSSGDQAKKAQEYEELAQWVRYGTGVAEPNRGVIVLQAGSPEEETSARFLINEAMAASNFGSDQTAPAFQVVDMRNQ